MNIGNLKNFVFNYIGHSVFIFSFLLIILYFILTKTLFDTGLKKSDWLRRVNRLFITKKSGEFLAKDKQGNLVILEWEKTSPKEKDYIDETKKVSDFYCLSRIDVQLDFWKKHPAKCPGALKEFIKDDMKNIDFDLLKKKACELGKLAISQDFSENDEIVFFVNLRDKKTNQMLGSAIFGIGGEYDYGDVFIRDIVSKPGARDRGLGKLMASSVFKIVPDLAKIKVYVLDTNKNAILVYSLWDFQKEVVSSCTSKDSFVLMSYNIVKSKSLQKVAANLKFIG